jgi:hypothetical protein
MSQTPIVSDELWALIEEGTLIPNVEKTQIFTYPRFNGKKIIVEWSITLDQFRAIEKGNGGRAGIIPFFYHNFQPRYLLNISNRNLLSDFGGGIKAKQTIYDGFLRELSEEIPKWKNELIRRLEDEKNYHIIHCIETIYLDKQESKHTGLKHQILIICQVDPSTLLYDNDKLIYEVGVAPSKEVKSLMTMGHSELVSFLTNPINNTTMNNGLQQFKRIYHL